LTRVVRAAAAQMGPTQRADTRAHMLHRMLKLLDEAAERGAHVVFPELAFTACPSRSSIAKTIIGRCSVTVGFRSARPS
jgi:predicted amidohydrolase